MACVLGAVLVLGGCEQGPVAAAGQFCTDSEFWKCRRDQYAGRIGDEAFAECIARIEGACTGFAWSSGCRPTDADTQACLLLLQRADLADIETTELLAMHSECDLCPEP